MEGAANAILVGLSAKRFKRYRRRRIHNELPSTRGPRAIHRIENFLPSDIRILCIS